MCAHGHARVRINKKKKSAFVVIRFDPSAQARIAITDMIKDSLLLLVNCSGSASGHKPDEKRAKRCLD